MSDNSSASSSLLFGMIFVNRFLFSSAVENVCTNLLYQINRNLKKLNKGKCVKTDDNATNIYMRTRLMKH